MSRARAEELYEDFHKYGPKSRTRAPSSFRIPRNVRLAGSGLFVLYSSPKLNPTTYADEGRVNYIHELEKGVKVYFASGRTSTKVPSRVARAQELTCLGRCLGFAYKNRKGEEIEYECNPRQVEWYAVPNPTKACPKGHALLAIESKKRVIAMVWGGKLRVEPRGIVG